LLFEQKEKEEEEEEEKKKENTVYARVRKMVDI